MTYRDPNRNDFGGAFQAWFLVTHAVAGAGDLNRTIRMTAVEPEQEEKAVTAPRRSKWAFRIRFPMLLWRRQRA